MTSFFRYLLKTISNNWGLNGLSIKKHREIYNEWRDQIKVNKSPLDLEIPWLTIIAKNYMQGYLRRMDKNQVKVFEYGSGGSTLFFLKYSSQVISVEHDEEWHIQVTSVILKNNLTNLVSLLIKPEYSMSNETLDISNPTYYSSSITNSLFKNYVSAIDKYDDESFDIVLVDGRSRPSCLLHSLKKVKKGGLLVLDNAERRYYLSSINLAESGFSLVVDAYGALTCSDLFTQTNIYQKSV